MTVIIFRQTDICYSKNKAYIEKWSVLHAVHPILDEPLKHTYQGRLLEVIKFGSSQKKKGHNCNVPGIREDILLQEISELMGWKWKPEEEITLVRLDKFIILKLDRKEQLFTNIKIPAVEV